MKSNKLAAFIVLVGFHSMVVEAITNDWTGGAGNSNFGDSLNWSPDPEFTGSNPLVSTNIHRINSAATVSTSGTNFNYVSTILDHSNAVLTVTAGSAVTNSGGSWTEGTVDIFGRLDVGSGVIGSGVTGDDLIVNVRSGATFRGLGNNSFGGNANNHRDVLLDVWGDMTLKINMLNQWATASSNNNFLVKVRTGGVFQVNQSGTGNLNMKCDSNSTARVELWGGALNIGATNQYVFLNMTNAPGNGIVFKSAGSIIRVSGSNDVAVQEWISVGALSTEVPGSTIEISAASTGTTISLSVPVGGDPILGVSPASHDFGGIRVGGPSATFSFTATNSGDSALVGTVSIGGGASPFAVDAGASFEVAPAGFTNVVVSFGPGAAGHYSDTVVFASNGGGFTNDVMGSGYLVVESTNSTLTVVGENVHLGFMIASGALYRVEASTNLMNGLDWTAVFGPATNQVAGTVQYIDTNGAAYPVRSYRITSP